MLYQLKPSLQIQSHWLFIHSISVSSIQEISFYKTSDTILQSSITTEINSVQCCVLLQCSTQKVSSSVANSIVCFKHKNEFISSFVLFFHEMLLQKISLVKVGWFFNTSLNTLVPSSPTLFSAIKKKKKKCLHSCMRQSFHH